MTRVESSLRAAFLALVVVANSIAMQSPAMASTANGYQNPFSDSFFLGRGVLVTQYSMAVALDYDAWVWDPVYSRYNHRLWKFSSSFCIHNAYQQERDWGVTLWVYVNAWRVYDNWGWISDFYPGSVGSSGMCQYPTSKPGWYEAFINFNVSPGTGIRGRVESHQMGVTTGGTSSFASPKADPYTTSLP